MLHNIYIIKELITHNRNISHIRVDRSCAIFKTAPLFSWVSPRLGLPMHLAGSAALTQVRLLLQSNISTAKLMIWLSIELFLIPQVKINMPSLLNCSKHNLTNKFVKVHPAQLLAGVCDSLHQNRCLAFQYLFHNHPLFGTSPSEEIFISIIARSRLGFFLFPFYLWDEILTYRTEGRQKESFVTF